MTPSPEGYPLHNPERPTSEDLKPWLKELMHHHDVFEEKADKLLASIDRLPHSRELSEVLEGGESHNYKLGYLAAMILNWRDEGVLDPEFLPVAEVIAQKAKELGIAE